MPRPPGSQGGPGVRRDISRALQSQQVKESSASDQRSAWAPGCQGAGLAGGPARGRLGACRMEAWPGRGLGDREAQSRRAEFYCYIKVPRLRSGKPPVRGERSAGRLEGVGVWQRPEGAGFNPASPPKPPAEKRPLVVRQPLGRRKRGQRLGGERPF